MWNKAEIRRAFLEVEREELNDLPPDNEINFSPSERYQLQIEKIRKSLNHRGYFKTTGRRIAAIVIAAVVFLMAAAMAIAPVRTYIVNFFVNTFDTHTDFRWEEEVQSGLSPAPTTIETRYILAAVPEGFEESYYFYEPTAVYSVSWMDSNGSTIDYSQYTIDTDMSLDTEDTVLHQPQIHGQDAYWAQKDGYIYGVWADKGYIFFLNYPESFTESYFLEVAENLTELK